MKDGELNLEEICAKFAHTTRTVSIHSLNILCKNCTSSNKIRQKY